MWGLILVVNLIGLEVICLWGVGGGWVFLGRISWVGRLSPTVGSTFQPWPRDKEVREKHRTTHASLHFPPPSASIHCCHCLTLLPGEPRFFGLPSSGSLGVSQVFRTRLRHPATWTEGSTGSQPLQHVDSHCWTIQPASRKSTWYPLWFYWLYSAREPWLIQLYVGVYRMTFYFSGSFLYLSYKKLNQKSYIDLLIFK